MWATTSGEHMKNISPADNLRYVYSSSLALIKAVEDGVKKGLNNSSNEW